MIILSQITAIGSNPLLSYVQWVRLCEVMTSLKWSHCVQDLDWVWTLEILWTMGLIWPEISSRRHNARNIILVGQKISWSHVFDIPSCWHQHVILLSWFLGMLQHQWCWWAGAGELLGGQNWLGLTRERRAGQVEPEVLQVHESKMKR